MASATYETDKGPEVPNVFGLKLPKRHEEVTPPLGVCTGKGNGTACSSPAP